MVKLLWAVGTLFIATAGCGDAGGGADTSATGGPGSTGDTTGPATVPTTGTGDAPTSTGSTGTGGGGNTQGMTDTGDPTGATDTTTTVGTDPTTTTATATDGTDATTGTTSVGDTSTSGVVPDTTTGSTGDGTTGLAESSTGVGESSSTGEEPPCEPGDVMGGMGKVEKSYIWISSHNLHELSKVDTLTMTEVARYKTGPANLGQNPSRTAVSADGRYVVVNNRDSGRSTMVASNLEDCVDKNGNGEIDTSQNKNNILTFGADECVRWSVVLPFAGSHQSGPRGVTWTPGEWSYDECKYVEPKVWVGYLAAGNVAHFARIDGETGVVEETLLAPGWKGASGYGPYGAALDPEFRPWFSSLRAEFIRVNTDQDPITLTRIDPPGYVQSYGFTIDRDGDAWFGGWDGPVTVYDTEANTFTAIAGTSGAHRGVAADEDFVWAAHNSPCQLVQVDRKTRTLMQKHVTNPCNTAIGLSIDVEKYVWLVDQGGYAWKFKPDNVPGAQKIDVVGSHYVYSDMTGGQLLSILPQ